MKVLKRVLKYLGFLIAIPMTYLIISLVLSAVTTNNGPLENKERHQVIYLSTNGVHLDIILPRELMSDALLEDVVFLQHEKYLAFGWGDEGFYLNTPTWGDLTFTTACNALFFKSPTLMHVTRHSSKRASWTSVPISKSELEILNEFILQTFDVNAHGQKVELPETGYDKNDNFYKAKGSYSFLKTCNSWANKGFKESGLKAAIWTPFDFGLLNKYEQSTSSQ